MPIIYRDYYGRRPRPDGELGYIEIVPTAKRYYETDGSGVRWDRVKVFDGNGRLAHTFIQDKLGGRFVDNTPDTGDDIEYLNSLPSRERE